MQYMKKNFDELLYICTYRCNKKCKFCYNDIFGKRIDRDCSESIDYYKLINTITELGVKRVYISGGEPSMRDDFIDLVNIISQRADVALFTNGLLFDKYSATEIAQLPVEEICITLYQKDLITFSAYLGELLHTIQDVQAISPTIKFNAQVMLDANYFVVKTSDGFLMAKEVLDRIIWQPLSLNQNDVGYSQTIEGMDKHCLNSILADMYASDYGLNPEHATIIRNLFDQTIGPYCRMGYNYLVLSPDNKTIRPCPHRNYPCYTLEQVKEIGPKLHDSTCVCSTCICLYYHLERKYKD